jgi:hypothetical protein
MPVPIITSGMRRVAFLRPALALAQHQHGSERRDAGVDVDGGATGEVERAALAQPSAEHPLEHGHVHDQRPHGHEDRPCRELHPVGHRAADERRGDGGEHAEIGDDRQLATVVLTDADVLQHQRVEVAEEVVLERHLGQRVPDHHPHDGDDQDAVEVHHQHVQHVARAVHTAVEEGESGRHEQHECSRHQDPCDVAALHGDPPKS